MNSLQAWILISIIALAIIRAMMVILRRKGRNKPFSKLAALAFLFIFAGAVFGDDRLKGYSLMGIGITLAIVDIIKSSRGRNINKIDRRESNKQV